MASERRAPAGVSPSGAFFYGLSGQPNRGPDPDNNSGQVDPLGLDPLSLGCLPFSSKCFGLLWLFLWLKQLAIGIAGLRLTFIPQGLLN